MSNDQIDATPIEQRLATALRRRAEGEPVSVPDVGRFTGSSVGSDSPDVRPTPLPLTGATRRRRAILAVAAAIVVAVGGFAVRNALTDTSSGLSTIDQPNGPEEEQSALEEDGLASTADDSSLPAAEPLIEVPPLDWAEIPLPPATNGDSGGFVGAIGDDALYSTVAGAWRWSADSQTWSELTVPEGEQIQAVVSNDPTDPLVRTQDPRLFDSPVRIWSVVDDRLVDPTEPIASPDAYQGSSPEPDWVTDLLVVGNRQRLYVARSFSLNIDFAATLRNQGKLDEDDRLCDRRTTGRSVWVTVQTDPEQGCDTSAGLRHYELSAAQLGRTETELAELEAFEANSPSKPVDPNVASAYVTIIERRDDGIPNKSHRALGLVTKMALDDEGSVVAALLPDPRIDKLNLIAVRGDDTWGWNGLKGIAPSTNASIGTTVFDVVNGLPVLSTVREQPDAPPIVRRMSLDSRPDFEMHLWPNHTPSHIAAFPFRLADSEAEGLAVSVDGERWSFNRYDELGEPSTPTYTSGTAVITDSHAIVLVGSGGTPIGAFAAPLPDLGGG